MVLKFDMNWDEFYVLNYVYRYEAGEITTAIQSIWVHAFGWLRGMDGNEISQIIAARWVMLGCFMITCSCLYGLARRYTSQMASLLAVLAYIGFAYVFRSAISFRADAPLTAAMMGALWLAAQDRQTWPRILAAGALMAIGGLLSMKAIFYVPIIAIFLLLRWQRNGFARRQFFEAASMGAASLIIFTTLYYLHSLTLPRLASSGDFVGKMGAASLLHGKLFLQSWSFYKSAIQNPVYWMFVLIAFPLMFSQIFGKNKLASGAGLERLAFGLPLLCLIFYRHAHPYFYVFMLAPVSVWVAISIDFFLKKSEQRLALPILAVLTFWVGSVFVRSMGQDQAYQRQVVALVHEIFPQPVTYIDFCAMISSFPRIDNGALFINSHTLDRSAYFAAKQPVLDKILQNNPPKLVLGNVKALDFDDKMPYVVQSEMLPQDDVILRANYRHFWGPIYLPGQDIAAADTGTINSKIPGLYTVVSQSNVQINGQTYISGDTITLEKASYAYQADNAFTLSWGDNLVPPQEGWDHQRLFYDF